MIEAILLSMLSLPALSYPQGLDPETGEQRRARFEVIATAIDTATREATCTTLEPQAECTVAWPADQRDQLAAMMVTLAWYESKFAWRVHAGKCFTNECDALHLQGGVVIHRSRTVWQVQRNPRMVSSEEWKGLVGTSPEATLTAARVAARILISSRGRCAKGTPDRWEAPTVAAYATGAHCAWSKALGRVNTYKKVLRGLAEPKGTSKGTPAPATPLPPASPVLAPTPSSSPPSEPSAASLSPARAKASP